MKLENILQKSLYLFYLLVLAGLIYFGMYFYNKQYDFILSKDKISMLNNSDYQIIVIGQKKQYASNEYIYESSNSEVASVDENGNVKAKKSGKADITIKSKKGNNKERISIEVSDDNLYLISFENDNIDMITGEKYEVKPLINNSFSYDLNLCWSSSDKKVASVDENGIVTANNSGVSYIEIKIKDTEYSSRVRVNVTDKDDEIKEVISEEIDDEEDEFVPVNDDEFINNHIDVKSITASVSTKSLKVGEQEKLTYEIYPDNATNKKVEFSSSNSEILSVDSSGNIKALKEGSANVIVTTNEGNISSFVTIEVVEIKLEKIEISNKISKMNTGDSKKFSINYYPSDTTSKKLIWSTSDKTIASVDNKGKVKALKEGKATISVKSKNDDSVFDKVDINIIKKIVKVSSISLNKSKTNLVVNEKEKLRVIFKPNNVTNKKVKWSSSNNNVASVDNKGNILAIREGTAKITAISEDGNKESTCVVNVKNKKIPIESISLSENNITMYEKENKRLTIKVNPSNATNQNVTWSSSNNSIASVDDNGLINAKKEGQVVIIVTTSDGIKSICNVIVKKKIINVESIELKAEIIEIPTEEKYKMEYQVFPNDATNKNVKWSSSNSSVAKVDNSGMVTAIKPGRTIIKVKSIDGNIEDECVVNVILSNNSVLITSLAFEKSNLQMKKGETTKLNISITPSNAYHKVLTWKSSNTSVVTVDNNGNIKGIAYGSATITANTNDGSNKKVSIKIVVVPSDSVYTIKDKKFKNYITNIATVRSNKYVHMQNFAISNIGKPNEVIYLSTADVGHYTLAKNPTLTAAKKDNILRSVVFKVTRKTLSSKNNRPTMYIGKSGHGQAFDIEENSDIMWINSNATVYKAAESYWGKHTGLQRIKFKETSKGGSVSPIINISIKDSNNKAYSFPTPSIDYKNDLIAITTGDNVVTPASTRILVYKYSDFKKGKLTLLYSFVRASKLKSYRQGTGLKGGYYYELRGNPGESSHIEAYDMLGNQIYSQKMGNGYTTANEREAEGIHFYNGKMYIGTTHKKNGNYYFDINYYE